MKFHIAIVTGDNAIAPRCHGPSRNLIALGGVVRVETHADEHPPAIFEDRETAYAVALACHWNGQRFGTRAARPHEVNTGVVVTRDEVESLLDVNGHAVRP